MIAGSANEYYQPYFQKLKESAPQNVTFLGSVTDEKLIQLYSHAQAVIQTHPDEDLGRVPIEAMASGKPCFAVNAGGFRETIINGKTGILINPPYIEKLSEAIRHHNILDFNPKDCLERASLFSEEAHVEKMRKIVSKI